MGEVGSVASENSATGQNQGTDCRQLVGGSTTAAVGGSASRANSSVAVIAEAIGCDDDDQCEDARKCGSSGVSPGAML